ncbi:alpha/beta hydrolase [Phytomonospora sp. NPDC050363]|uniref:alpha/beta hydrolase n=1 Tax=Phytomonospora sp. NPDC050363 TaxID=3155642 RepID=UPI0033F76B90
MTDATVTKRALVIPGGRGGPYTPWCAYPADAAEYRGAEVEYLWWSRMDPGVGLAHLADDERGPWTEVDLKPAFEKYGPDRPLVIAKSLGTFASPLAADHETPAVWLTPLLTSPWVVAGLRRATAPFLLVGGTGDPSWNPELARELTPWVHEIPGADHGFYVPGPLSGSLAAMAGIVEAVETFLDETVWPARERPVRPR